MDNKSYTILIATNRHDRTIKLTLRSSWVKALGFLGFCLILLMGSAAIDYVGLLLKANQNVYLRTQNASLHRQFQVTEEKVATLEANLEQIRNFTRKLNLITDVGDQDRVLKLALSPNSQAVTPVDQHAGVGVSRIPSSEYLIHEPQTADQPQQSNEEAGDVAVNQEMRPDYATLAIRIDRDLRESQLREQGVLQLWDTLSERKSLLASTPSIRPVQGWYTSRFGYRADPYTGRPDLHPGVDIAAPFGTPVHATADGVVSFAGYDGGYGKLVAIDNGYGVVTRFGHNSRIFVEVGQHVHRGDVISAIGSTGRSTGPHCHYEVRVHGIPVDPTNYILND